MVGMLLEPLRDSSWVSLHSSSVLCGGVDVETCGGVMRHLRRVARLLQVTNCFHDERGEFISRMGYLDMIINYPLLKIIYVASRSLVASVIEIVLPTVEMEVWCS